MNAQPEKTTVPALDKSIRILDLLAQTAEPMSGADIAKSLNLPRSSVHGLLAALTANGLLDKSSERHYVLGPHLLYWARNFLVRQDIVAEFYRAISDMPELSPYTLTLSVLNHNQVVYLACKNSDLPLGLTFQAGMQLPAVFTATGKILLSTMSDSQIAKLCTELPPPYTERSIRSFSQLQQEIQQARAKGYAVDDGQLRLGMICYGVAVPNPRGTVRYGLAASLIAQEAQKPQQQKNLLNLLERLAKRLSNQSI